MRVASGMERVEDAILDPQTELSITKTVEIFGESIPSSVLQTYALLGSEVFSRQAVFSIFVSAGCIAFVSSTISLDFDTDNVKRLIAPSFYVSSIITKIEQSLCQAKKIPTQYLSLVLFLSLPVTGLYAYRVSNCGFCVHDNDDSRSCADEDISL